MTAIITTALAILGTIAGAIVSGHYQQRAARHTERITHDEALRRDRLNAVTELAAAISEHRALAWLRGDAKLSGDNTKYAELREPSRQSRRAVTRPLISLRVLISDQAVREAADAMVASTYALPDAATDTETLTAAREAAVIAHDEFVDVAAAYLTLA